MKCPFCNGSGVNTTWVATDTVSEFKQTCFKCHGTGEIEQTNEEWMRTLPADERVKEILNRGFMKEKRTAEEFVKWLKEKHE